MGGSFPYLAHVRGPVPAGKALHPYPAHPHLKYCKRRGWGSFFCKNSHMEGRSRPPLLWECRFSHRLGVSSGFSVQEGSSAHSPWSLALGTQPGKLAFAWVVRHLGTALRGSHAAPALRSAANGGDALRFEHNPEGEAQEAAVAGPGCVTVAASPRLLGH